VSFELDEKDAKRLCSKGTDAYREGRFPDAINQLKQGLSVQTDNWEARLFLGMSYFKVNEPDHAVETFQYILDKSDDEIIKKKADMALAIAKKEAAREAVLRKKREEARAAAARAEAAKKRDFLIEFFKGLPLPQKIAITTVFVLGTIYGITVATMPMIYQALFIDKSVNAVSAMGTIPESTKENVTIPSGNGNKLSGVLFRKEGATRIVLVHPEISGEKNNRSALTETLLRANCNVLLYDARGMGDNAGEPSWDTVVEDGLFAYDYVHGGLGFGHNLIVNYGYGLGCAPALTATAQHHCNGLILENPFCSLPELAREDCPFLVLFPDSLCPTPQMRLSESLLEDHGPVLVLQSKGSVVPRSESKQYFDRLTDPKTFAAVDNTGTSEGDTQSAAIVPFLRDLH
jgi:hypothetical protein